MPKNAITTISFNGNLLKKASDNNDTLCVAAFIALSYHVPHKRFAVNQIGEIALKLRLSESEIYRYIGTMKKYRLIEKRGKKYYISSIKKIHEIYGGKDCVSAVCPTKVIKNGIKAVQQIIKSIPIISCGKAQEKAIKQKENYFQIKQAKNDPKAKVSKKMLQWLKSFEGKNNCSDVCVNSNLQLSIQGIMNLLGCSKTTAIKRKRLLEYFGVLHFQRQYEVLLENVSMEEVRMFRREKEPIKVGVDFDEITGQFTSFKEIPNYFRYDKRTKTILIDKCSTFRLSYLECIGFNDVSN